eukprot:8343098-Ditylum_brightwellii.AAC.1
MEETPPSSSLPINKPTTTTTTTPTRTKKETIPSTPPQPHDARFHCNICLDPVSEPVVTRCGHLYCWPCLYIWLAPGITASEAHDVLNQPLLQTPQRELKRGRDGSLRIMYNRRNQYNPLTSANQGMMGGGGGGGEVEVDESRRCCPVCKSSVSVRTLVPIYVRTEPTPTRTTRKEEEDHSTCTEDEHSSLSLSVEQPLQEEEEEEEVETPVLRRRRPQPASATT